MHSGPSSCIASVHLQHGHVRYALQRCKARLQSLPGRARFVLQISSLGGRWPVLHNGQRVVVLRTVRASFVSEPTCLPGLLRMVLEVGDTFCCRRICQQQMLLPLDVGSPKRGLAVGSGETSGSSEGWSQDSQAVPTKPCRPTACKATPELSGLQDVLSLSRSSRPTGIVLPSAQSAFTSARRTAVMV